MGGRRTIGRPAVLGIATLIVFAVPTLAGFHGGGTSSFDWSLSEGNVSALSVEFVVNASDTDPTISYTVDVGTNRTDDTRALAGAILWNRTEWLASSFTAVNEEDLGYGASARHITLSRDVVEIEEGQYPAENRGGFSPSPDHWGRHYELTLFGAPEGVVNVTIAAPGGGYVEAVDRGPVRMTPLEDFDSWDGVRGPAGTAATFHEDSSHDEDVVAVANAGGFLQADVQMQSVRTPEGCTASQTSADAVLVGLAPEGTRGFDCPPGITEPKGGFFFDSVYYRGHDPGTFTWNGTYARANGDRFTFLLTAELDSD